MDIQDSENLTSDSIIINSSINDIREYTHEDKKDILKRITNIKNKKCYIKIFKLIHNDKLSYTKNENGIFFNLNNLSNEKLHQINKIVQYYENI